MTTFAPGYVKPGPYLTQKDISPPAAQPGVRVFAPIGQGSKTLVRLDALKRGATLNGQDGPLTFNTVINVVSVVDSNGVVYNQNGEVDYILTRPTAFTAVIDWSPTAPPLVGATDLTALLLATPDLGAGPISGTNLNIVVNGVNYVVVLSGPFANPAAVVAFINSWDPAIAGIASLDGTGNHLVLTPTMSIIVNPCSANGVLGFTQFQSSSVKKPAAGQTYNVYYVSDKMPIEYKPMAWADPNKIVSWYGLPQPQTHLDNGTASSSTYQTVSALATFLDGTKAWTPNQFIGCYLKVIGGTGEGQVRVIVGNTPTGLILSQDWNALSAPDSSSTYIITDVNDNSISMGSLTAAATGATVFITSQYPDDIYNASNIQAAIDNLKQDISGSRPYCLVLMRGISSTDVGPVGYLKNHVTTMSNTINNKWRCAFVGMAQGNDNYNTFVTLARGMNSNRMVLLSNSSITNDFGYGNVLLDGAYFACAHAGIMCANEESSTPMLLRSISAAFDVSLYSDPFLDVEKNLMAAAGVTVYERAGVDLVCRDALNTAIATVLEQETKLTRSMDYVSNYLVQALNSSVVGQRFITSGSGPSNVIVLTTSILNFVFADLLAAGTISKPPQNVSVKQDPIEPRQMDITADIYLTTDVKWVYILAGFGVG